MPDFRTRHPYLAEVLILCHGGAMAMTFAPENGWPLAPLLPMVLLWGWDGATPLQAARRGGLFGLGLFGVGIHWIFISLHDYGNAPAPFAALATFAVVVLMALYPAVTGWLLVRWGPPPGLIRWCFRRYGPCSIGCEAGCSPDFPGWRSATVRSIRRLVSLPRIWACSGWAGR